MNSKCVPARRGEGGGGANFIASLALTLTTTLWPSAEKAASSTSCKGRSLSPSLLSYSNDLALLLNADPPSYKVF